MKNRKLPKWAIMLIILGVILFSLFFIPMIMTILVYLT